MISLVQLSQNLSFCLKHKLLQFEPLYKNTQMVKHKNVNDELRADLVLYPKVHLFYFSHVVVLNFFLMSSFKDWRFYTRCLRSSSRHEGFNLIETKACLYQTVDSGCFQTV